MAPSLIGRTSKVSLCALLFTLPRRSSAEWTSFIQPATHLEEEFPDVAAYLHTVGSTTSDAGVASDGHGHPSQYAENAASDELTSALLERARDIMQRAEAEGRTPDEELRQLVGETVLQGMLTGYGLGVQADQTENRAGDVDGGVEAKRSRTDEST